MPVNSRAKGANFEREIGNLLVKDLNLIKGGGGAHTNEKKLAKQANEFICIIDDQKLVNCLGDFPLPVEVKIAEANKVIPVLKQFSNNISNIIIKMLNLNCYIIS